MIYKVFRLFLILFFILTYSACSEEEGNPCEGMESGHLPIMTFDDLFINDTISCWLKEEIDDYDVKGELYFRIDNQVQFDTLVKCNCDLPIINFDDYTLLMGKKLIPGSGTLALQRVYLNCDDPQVIYQVDISVDTTTEGVSVFQYHAAIPKLPNDIIVYFLLSKHFN